MIKLGYVALTLARMFHDAAEFVRCAAVDGSVTGRAGLGMLVTRRLPGGWFCEVLVVG